MKKTIRSLSILFGFIGLFMGFTITCYAQSKKHTVIEILHGNPSNGSLTLSDPYPRVDQFYDVIWIVSDKSNVKSIVDIKKYDTSPGIFLVNPSGNERKWKGRVWLAPEKDYVYYIKWTEKGNPTVRTCDPKISVKPSITLPFQILLLILMGLVPLLMVRYAYKRMKARRTQ